MNKVITGTIHQGDFDALKQIMRDQSSCRRYAYNRIHKDGISKANDVVKACKPLYMDRLNQRYIQDAVLRAKGICMKTISTDFLNQGYIGDRP